MNTYEKETEILLRKLGVNRTYIGFKQVSYGVRLTIDNPFLLTHISKGLYVEIATYSHTTLYCVERNIRTIKELIWKKADKELLKDIFGNIDEIPRNAEFMDDLAFYVWGIVNNESF